MDIDLNLPKKKVVLGPASLWKRALAFMIDMLLIDLIIMGPFRTIILSIAGFNTQDTWKTLLMEPQNTGSIMLIFTLLGVFTLLYFTLSEYLIGQTLGKVLLKLKVVSLAPESPMPGFWSCFIRSVFILPVLPFYFLWILDPIFMMFNPNGQRLTEFIGATMTVETYQI